MKLRPWIFQQGLTVADFANKIGRSETTVNRWITGTREPRFADMRRIHDITMGAVTPNDFVLRPEGV